MEFCGHRLSKTANGGISIVRDGSPQLRNLGQHLERVLGLQVTRRNRSRAQVRANRVELEIGSSGPANDDNMHQRFGIFRIWQ